MSEKGNIDVSLEPGTSCSNPRSGVNDRQEILPSATKHQRGRHVDRCQSEPQSTTASVTPDS